MTAAEIITTLRTVHGLTYRQIGESIGMQTQSVQAIAGGTRNAGGAALKSLERLLAEYQPKRR